MDARERKIWSTKVARELGQAKRRAERELDKVGDELRSTFEGIEHSVRKNPKQSAIIALALGAAIGAAGMRLLKSKNVRKWG